jgi:hypothetical protein
MPPFPREEQIPKLRWRDKHPILEPAIKGILLVLALVLLLVGYFLYSPRTVKTTTGLPEYKWPPPRPSDSVVTVPGWLKQCATLGEVYQEIRKDVQKGEYPNVGLYSLARAGFMVVTAPERIHSNGSIGSDRWQITRQEGDFEERMRVSFNTAPEGLYRFFIIAVTSNPANSDSEWTPRWIRDSLLTRVGDFAELPVAQRDVPLTDEYRLHVYLYFWRREKLERFPHFEESEIGIIQHLRAAGLNDLLNSKL